MSEDSSQTLCFICVEEEPVSFKQALRHTYEAQVYFKRKEAQREEFMKKILKEKLTTKDKFLFYFYKKLADYFGGGERVVTMQKRGSLDESMVGIKIYGKDYWLNEKEVADY
tara:strand:+ start:7751 stop:8086 length:336 start_codon:yes stop_codon:yes gene_type:complete